MGNNTEKLGWIDKLLALWVGLAASFCTVAALIFCFTVGAWSW